MFRIAVNNEIELDAQVPAVHMPKLSPGATVRISRDDAADLIGRVRLVSPEIDRATQLGRVRISVTNNPSLKAGMFARGEFAPLLGWLRKNIHSQGKRYLPRDLVRRVTGSDLSPEPLLRHLPRRRFVLAGDSGQHDPEVFGDLARRYPRQVRRIFIRDVGRSTPARYSAAFAGLERAVWQVFTDPATLPALIP